MKIRTADEFVELVDTDLAWRRKELQYIYGLACEDSGVQLTYIRAGVALLYAHWEGFVVSATRMFIVFLTGKRVQFNELLPGLLALGASREFGELGSRLGLRARVALVKRLMSLLSEIARLKDPTVISANSNLNTDRLLGLLEVSGIDTARYENRRQIIDERLVALRNSICHGERSELDQKEFEKLYVEVTELIDTFRSDIQNVVVTGSYRIAAD